MEECNSQVSSSCTCTIPSPCQINPGSATGISASLEVATQCGEREELSYFLAALC